MKRITASHVAGLLAAIVMFTITAGSALAATRPHVRPPSTCHSKCVDDCWFPFQRDYQDVVWTEADNENQPTFGCVEAASCSANGSGCGLMLAPPLTNGVIDRLVAATRGNDAAYVAKILASSRAVHVRLDRSALQVDGCGSTVSLSIPLSATLVGALERQGALVAAQTQ